MMSKMESRKRLYTWLKQIVENELYGLKWLDKEKQIFSIPWMHKSNPAWTEHHFQVFKEWALFTNMYKEDVDWSTLKTRLRTALNKLPDFQEMSKFHVKGEYKVYRFVFIEGERNLENHQQSPGLTDNDSNSCSSTSQISTNAEKTFFHYNIQQSHFPRSSSEGIHCGPQHIVSHPNSFQPSIYFDALSSDSDQSSNTYCLGGYSCNPTFLQSSQGNMAQSNQQHFPHQKEVAMSFETHEKSMAAASMVTFESQDKSMDTNSLPSDLKSVEKLGLFLESKLPSDEMNQYKASPVTYKIYYLNQVVKEGILYDKKAHLYFGQTQNFTFSKGSLDSSKFERIELPPVSEVSNRLSYEQQQYIHKVLSKLNAGFYLHCVDGDIYAERLSLCHTRIFAWNPLMGNITIERKGEKEQKEIKLFDRKVYKDNLNIQPKVILTLAQEYTPETLKNIFIHVELIPEEAKVSSCRTFSSENSTSMQTDGSFVLPASNSKDKSIQDQMSVLSLEDNSF